MKSKIIAAVMFAATAAFGQATFEIKSDLSRQLVPFNLQITEDIGATITARFLYEGSDLVVTNSTGLLAYGSGGGGVWLTNDTVSGSTMTWTISGGNTPTNGRYNAQIFGVTGAVTQEWARGNLSVRLNTSRSFQPTNWFSGAVTMSDFLSFSNSITARVSNLETNGTGGGGGDLSALSNGLSSVSNRLVTHTGLTTAAHGGIVADTDARLTNSRPPTAHTQDYTSITGAIPWLTVEADTNALAVVAALTNQVVYTNDARLTDARTPLAHNQAWGSITDAPAIPAQIADHTALTNQNGSTNFMHLTTAQVARVAASLTNETDAIAMDALTNGTVWASFQQIMIDGISIIGSPSTGLIVPIGEGSSLENINTLPELVRTNDTRYLAAISNIIVNGTTGTVAAGVASVTITDSDTNYVAKTGDTMSGALLTDRTTGFLANELVPANWVRELLAVGTPIYMTTNIVAVGWLPTNTTFAGHTVVPAASFSENVTVTGAQQYVASMITTNAITGLLRSPVTAEIFLSSPGGGGRSLSAKPEIYWTTNKADLTITNGDFSAAAQVITCNGTTNRYTFSIAFPEVTLTNVYIVARLKTTAVGGSTTNVVLSAGGTTPSMIQFRMPDAASISGGGITNLTASTNSAGVAVQVDASNWTIGTSIVATASLDTNTVIALAQVVATNAVNDAGRYPYILASAPTTTLTRAMGNLVMLELTSNVTLFQIDNTGWSTNERAYGELDLDLKGFSFAWNTNVGQFSGTSTLVVPTNGMARFRWDGLPHRDTNTANKAVRQ
jgi:hypothetical protein